MIHSIRTQILALLAGVLLAGLVTWFALANALFTRDRLAYTYDLTSSLATTVSEQLRESLGSRVDKLLYFAAASSRGDPLQQARLLVESDPDLLGVELWRSEGGRFERVVAWSDLARLDAADLAREDVDEARRTAPVAFEALTAEGPQLQNASLPPDVPLLTLAAASPDGRSAVVAILKPDRLLRIFARSAAYRVYLVDGRGRVVVHPDPARVVGRADVSGSQIVHQATRGPVARAVRDFEGPDGAVIGAFARVGLGRLVVVAEVPRAEALRATRDLGRRTILLGLAILFVGILASYLLGRRITAPLRHLQQAALRVGAGELGTQVPVEGRGETAELAAAFNRMSGELADRESRLSEAHTQLSRADKLSAVGELAASIAHEVKNPVTAVVGYAQLGRETLDLAEAHELFGLVEQQGWRAGEVLQSLLEFTRREPTAPEPVAPAALVDETLRLLRHPLRLRGVTVTSELAEGLPTVLAHAGELQQVLVNLLLNAADAMEGREQRRVTVRASAGEGQVLLAVSDSGTGIPPELRGKIFQPFFTTKKGRDGTGLGLSVSQRIVKDLGGEIRLESTVGEGSTFTVVLPPAPREA
ncbi:MAG TPA: ATP-binding protein [Anaeromyxobacteraceae bacterium]|nr:ATP-binding protein [Anaeromyxobacteraceae bacterium]